MKNTTYLELCRIPRKAHLGLAKAGLNSGGVLFSTGLNSGIVLYFINTHALLFCSRSQKN